MNERAPYRRLALVLLLAAVVAAPAPAGAVVMQGTLEMTVDQYTAGAFGLPTEIPVGTPFVFSSFFRVAYIGGGQPDPSDLPADLLDFDLTIGNTQWDETMPHSDVTVLVQGASLLGIQMTLTDTLPTHPDLSFFLPTSPGTWEAKDLDDRTIGGTYQVNAAAVAEPAMLGFLAAGLVSLAGLARQRTRR